MKKYIGEFELGNTVDITDPCYDKSVWCRITTECKPGTYKCYIDIDDDSERVASIWIYNDDKYVHVDEISDYIGTIGVDAGLAGFFNNKPDYDDNEWDTFLYQTGMLDGEDWAVVEYGAFSQSGYGDGSYDVFASRNRDAFMIVFMEDDEDEDEEYDY